MDHVYAAVGDPLPASFVETRRSLHALACYVLGPARKVRTGRIGLRPVDGGFGTPPFEDGTRLVVIAEELRWQPGRSTRITTLRDAAAFTALDLSADPGVGSDLPPFTPDLPLAVDPGASLALGAWYAFGAGVLAALQDDPRVGEVEDAQLWPEHFDLAVVVRLPSDQRVNVGFSPGDAVDGEPYLYVGPHDTTGLDGPFWNAPFGAAIGHEELQRAADARDAALAFVRTGLEALHLRATEGH